VFLVVGSRFVVSLSRNVDLDAVVVVGVDLVCDGGLIDATAVLLLLLVVAVEDETAAGIVRDGDV